MSGKCVREVYIRKLNELREPGRPLCKHDWVGDDDCVYCRNEELEDEIMKTKGMSSLNEDDVRRIARDEMSNVLDEFYGTLANRLISKFKSLPQATDTEPPAT